jgi:hypothetical protein
MWPKCSILNRTGTPCLNLSYSQLGCTGHNTEQQATWFHLQPDHRSNLEPAIWESNMIACTKTAAAYHWYLWTIIPKFVFTEALALIFGRSLNSNLNSETSCPDWGFSVDFLSLQANVGTLHSIRQWLLPSTFFTINYVLIIQPFNTIYNLSHWKHH